MSLSPWEKFRAKIVGKVEAAKTQCWFFHRWGKWSDAQRSELRQRVPNMKPEERPVVGYN